MVYSADRIPGAEALAAQNRLSSLLRYNLKQEYSEMCGFVRVRVSLAIVRSNSLFLRGPCDKGARVYQRPELMDGAVITISHPGVAKSGREKRYGREEKRSGAWTR